MLKSTSGIEPSPPRHTCDASPVKSKVAPRLTASQGIDYCSTACTVNSSHHWEGNRRSTDCRTSVDTPYIVFTAQVPLHMFLTSTKFSEVLRNFTMPNLRKMEIIIDFSGNLVIFAVSLLNNWLVNVVETFTDILEYYIYSSNDCRYICKVYVVKKYLKLLMEKR